MPKTTPRRQALAALLSRAKGVTLDEIVKAWGVQRHSARAAITKLGQPVTRDEDGRYHLAKEAAR